MNKAEACGLGVICTFIVGIVAIGFIATVKCIAFGILTIGILSSIKK